MPKQRRAALYLRVSTDRQTTDNQRAALVAEAERRGWQVVATYEDSGISGAKGRAHRPGLDALLRDATRGRFDVAMCWALDRLGRSLPDLIGTLQELESAHVDLYIQQQSIDTTAPAGRLFFHMLGAFAEFERAMIQARVVAGMERARKAGKRVGRPRVGREKDAAAREARAKLDKRIRAALMAGGTIHGTARELGCTVGAVRRIKDAMRAAPGSTAPD